MIFFENITFLYPVYFLLSIPVFILIIYIYLKQESSHFFSGFSDLQKVYGSNALFHKLFFVLMAFISFLFICLLAWPVSYTSEKKVEKNGIEIQIVLDLSYSMIAEDLSPNRLEVAKNVIGEFILSRKTDRIWLVLFSWKPFTSIPLTFDYDFIREYVDDISIDIIDRNNPRLWWTAIGDGLLLAYDWLISEEENQQGDKIIILITDWEANTGIDPITALKALKDANIKIYSIWVWGIQDTYIDYVDSLWFQSRLAIWWVDENTLKTISSETWGIYYRATSSETMQEIFADISELEKTDIEETILETREERQEPFLYMLVFLFLLMLALISYKNIAIS